MPRSTQKFITGLICLLLAAVLYFGVTKDLLRLSLASPNWPTVSGQVLENSVVVDGSQHALVFRYDYLVAGTRYEGTSRYFDYGDGKTSLGFIQQDFASTVEAYPVGSRIAVHYHPDAPAVATILTGLQLQSYLLLLLTGTFTFAGISLLFFSRRWRISR